MIVIINNKNVDNIELNSVLLVFKTFTYQLFPSVKQAAKIISARIL